MDNTKEVFDDIYRNKRWGYPASGVGSSLNSTRHISAKLPEVFDRLGIKSFLDCGCGDQTWLPHVDMTGVGYTGLDVSEAVISDLRMKFPDRDFHRVDICKEPIPRADLAFSRDVLVHLPFTLIHDFLSQVKKAGITYLMTTSFMGRSHNTDCRIGEWRTLNFEANPFNFPIPYLVLCERCPEGGWAYLDKSLCVWRVKDIPED